MIDTSKETYDFDRVVDRKGSHSSKYAATQGLISDYEEIIPLWVADMDFETPKVIRDAVIKRITEHPVLGYSVPPKEYYETLKEWFRSEYDLEIEIPEIEFTPGVVAALYKLLECLTEKGDGVAIMPPVYFPFADVINGSGRREVTAPLLIKNERYYIDWDRLEDALKESKVLVLCHPHNPGGRVWETEELERIAALAKKHGVTVISDEIHGDLTYPAHKHRPFPSISMEAREVGLSLMAPSKFFNMPGLVASHIYIPNPDLRKRVFGYFEANHLSTADCFTFDAVIAAYRHAAVWAKAALAYCEKNVAYISDFLRDELQGQVGMIRPEASFLVFLDFRKAGFSSPTELHEFIIRKAGVLMNEGSTFGEGGAFFMRLNVGTSRSVLEEVMRRLKKALSERTEGK